MRTLAAVATLLISAAANAADAQSLSNSASNSALANSVFSRSAPADAALQSPTAAARLNAAAFAVRPPGGQPLDVTLTPYASRAYEVALSHDWPAAISFDTKRFGVDVSPHAGLGVSDLGGSAEAGAMVQLSQRDREETAAERLRALGLRDGARFGDHGRWYLFAAASGRAVGLNMLHSDTGWDRAGWSQDAASTLIGDAQVGVGWRKGPLQTSLGYIHREIKGAHMVWGQDTRADSMVAFSLSIRPKQ